MKETLETKLKLQKFKCPAYKIVKSKTYLNSKIELPIYCTIEQIKKYQN